MSGGALRRLIGVFGPRASAAVVACAAAGWLAGCASPAPSAVSPPDRPPSDTSAAVSPDDQGDTGLAAVYAERASAGDAVFRFRPEASTVRMVAFRSGRSARLGHNHVLTAPRFTGLCAVPAGGTAVAGGRVDLVFRLDALRIDDPAQRAELGPAFASTLSTAAVDGTREHLLGDDGLQAARHPFVRIRSVRIVGEAPQVAADIEVELHGQRRTQTVALTVSGLPQQLIVSGALVLRQSDFGVTPYSVAGGLLAVADEVVIDVRLVGER